MRNSTLRDAGGSGSPTITEEDEAEESEINETSRNLHVLSL